MNLIYKAQLALQAQGFDPGKVDGVYGPNTAKAIRAFQRSRHIKATGQLGPRTISQLFGSDQVKPLLEEPVWYQHAKTFLGTKEIPGAKSNPTIIGWAKGLGKSVSSYFNNDDIPWCGLFLAHIMTVNVPDEPIPSNPLGAREWAKYGVSSPTPALGDILVFWRGSPNGWQGHAGFYAGESNTAYKVLGGNQSNAVTDDAWISKTRLIDARRPKNSQFNAKPVLYTASGKLSTNEA